MTALDDVVTERAAQDARWGEQNHPNGTGPTVLWAGTATGRAAYLARLYRDVTNEHAHAGRLTWLDIALEEIAEAFAEDDPARLRAEVVQCAAVFVAWAEAIDRRPS